MASERKRLEGRLDALCKEIVCKESFYICLRCRRHVKNGDPHHVVHKLRGSSWRRFDIKNIVWLCRDCHSWWHDNLGLGDRFFKYTWPEHNKYLDRYRGGKPAKISTGEMIDLVAEYREKLKELTKE